MWHSWVFRLLRLRSRNHARNDIHVNIKAAESSTTINEQVLQRRWDSVQTLTLKKPETRPQTSTKKSNGWRTHHQASEEAQDNHSFRFFVRSCTDRTLLSAHSRSTYSVCLVHNRILPLGYRNVARLRRTTVYASSNTWRPLRDFSC